MELPVLVPYIDRATPATYTPHPVKSSPAHGYLLTYHPAALHLFVEFVNSLRVLYIGLIIVAQT